MKLVRNYWLRWFLGFGAIGTIVLQLAFWLWFVYIVFQSRYQYPSITIVTNPFIEVSNPVTGQAVQSGWWALILLQIYLSFFCGIVGLIIAALLRVFRRRTK